MSLKIGFNFDDGLSLGFKHLDETKVSIEKQKTKQHRITAEKEKFLAELQLETNRLGFQRDVLTASLSHTYAERHHIMDRELRLKEQTFVALKETLEAAVKSNNTQLATEALHSINKLIDNSISTKALPTTDNFGCTYRTIDGIVQPRRYLGGH